MKMVACMALTPGMVLGEDVLSHSGKLLYTKDTVIDDMMIARLGRHSIMCVQVKEEIDYADTHFEKVRLSAEFKSFEKTYRECMPVYRDLMNKIVSSHTSLHLNRLMDLYTKITSCARNGEQIIDFLYNMLPSEDDLTHAHCLNSALIAGVFGQWLELPKEDINLLIQCGFFYDIGKLMLPYELIWKPDKLTDLEFTQMKTHTMLGFNLLKELDVNDHLLKAVLQHHERCDGSGYPSKLKGDKIDIFAKYTAIIDSYEAMTSARTYRQSLNPFQVIANYEKDGFAKYDEQLIRPILSHIAISQLGFKVRLNNDQEGEIQVINNQLSRPSVRCGETLIDLRTEPELQIIAIY